MSFVKLYQKAPMFQSFANELFNRSLSDIVGSDFVNTQPAVNVVETPNGFAIQVAAPGLEKNDFDVQVDKNLLTISAKKEQETTVAEGKFTRREFNFSSFKRSFQLPETVQTDNISATYEQGVLTLNIVKKDEAKPAPVRKIDIV
ncbi:MAG: Hsp20/alpha crystallin family protein [Saprospiraceae bacterium]|nr:Hsp20/alpha crystallin family protein [Saprospiraceae bacterium]